MSIKVFGITGTNGKTTASCMLKNVLKEDGKACGLIGTIRHEIGAHSYEPVNTTPGAELLAQYFAQMEEEGISYCAMEVSSHGIAQGRIDHIPIDYAGFTNLSQDHLDYHKTMEAYYQVKKRLFQLCKKAAAINLDDHYGHRLYAELREERPKLIAKGCSLKDENAYIQGRLKEETLMGSRVAVLEEGREAGEIFVPIPGEHFVQNALLAVTMARLAGIEFSAIKRGFETLPGVPGRIERIGNKEDTLGIVDYAHTPDGLKTLLETAVKFKRGRVICVFGCGGYRDKAKRSVMGEIAGTYADYCIITNDNPRGEPPENIVEAIEEGIHPTGCDYCILLDRYQAIKKAVTLATKWDIIVVAGKGHEKYQLTGGEKKPFDDSKVLKELLEKKYEKTYDE